MSPTIGPGCPGMQESDPRDIPNLVQTEMGGLYHGWYMYSTLPPEVVAGRRAFGDRLRELGANGVIVGSWLRRGGRAGGPIDSARAAAFAKAFRRA